MRNYCEDRLKRKLSLRQIRPKKYADYRDCGWVETEHWFGTGRVMWTKDLSNTDMVVYLREIMTQYDKGKKAADEMIEDIWKHGALGNPVELDIIGIVDRRFSYDFVKEYAELYDRSEDIVLLGNVDKNVLVRVCYRWFKFFYDRCDRTNLLILCGGGEVYREVCFVSGNKRMILAPIIYDLSSKAVEKVLKVWTSRWGINK